MSMNDLPLVKKYRIRLFHLTFTRKNLAYRSLFNEGRSTKLVSKPPNNVDDNVAVIGDETKPIDRHRIVESVHHEG